VNATVPSRIVEVLNSVSLRPVELLYEVLVMRQFLEAVLRNGLEHRPWVGGYFPCSRLERLPKMIGAVTPGPAEIQSQIGERLQFRWQASRQKRMCYTLVVLDS